MSGTKKIKPKSEMMSTLDSFLLAIDYDKSLDDMVEAGLRLYEYVHPDITEKNFPVSKGDAEVKVILLCLNRSASSREVLRELSRKSLRPDTMAEQVAFGAKHPSQLNKYFPIVALGSVWTSPDGDQLVGSLQDYDSGDDYGDMRELSLASFGSDWPVNSRFLAVRK